MPVQLSGSLLMSGSITATGLISAQGGISSVGAQQITDLSNPISFTSTASLYTDGGIRVTKDMFVSGTAYFNNVTIYGTQSVEYITSSQLNIGTNIITVNTDTPTVRYGGLAVYDSGSTGLTGSLLWDSEANHWIYTNPSGSTYSGGMMISGPRASARGCEQGTTSCALMVGQGGDHITSSGIFHYGNATCFYSNATVTSTGVGCFAGTICAPNITSTGTICTTMANASCIGIGTMTPTYTLDVNGTARISSANSELNLISTGASNTANFSVQAGEGAAAIITLKADDGDNAADITTLKQVDQGPFTINVNNDGVTALAINSSGISCFACRVCAAGLSLSENLSGTNANFSSYVTMGSLVVNDQGAAYYSFTNRIGGSTAINVNSINVTTDLGKFLCSGLSINSTGGATNNMYQIAFGYKDTNGVYASSAIAGIAESSDGYNTGALVFATRTLTTDTAPIERLRIISTGIACFSCQVCTPAIDIMPSGAGVNTAGGILRVITGGTAVGIGVGQSNTNRYTQISANDLLVYNDDFFIATRCAFPLSIGTCYTSRLTFAATGIACFSCTVCVPSLIARTSNITINPSTYNWYSVSDNSFKVLDFGKYGSVYSYQDGACYSGFADNAYFANSTFDWRYKNTQGATNLYFQDGNVYLESATSGTAGTVIPFSAKLKIDSNGIACFRCQVCLPTSNTSLVAGTYGTISNIGGIDTNIGNNAYYDGTNWRRFAAQEAARIYINRDSFSFLRKASDGAGSCISWDNTLFLAASGVACFACQVCAPVAIISECVGIGTTAPGSPLEIYSSNVFNTSTGANPHLIINYNSATAGGPAIKFSRVGISDWSAIQADLSGGTRTLKFIQTASGVASTQMVINANDGNVGIGTTSPCYKLDVSADINDGSIIRAVNLNSGAAATARFYAENNIGSLGQLTTYSSGFGFTVFGLAAGNYSALLSSGASSAGLLIGSLTSSPVVFGTNNIERLRITSAGIACFACQVCAPAFVGGTVTGTRMTVATDCSGVIVDVASRHGLMKYFNYSTGLVGCCTGTDGAISTWLGRFAGSITAPTAVYQDLVVTNTGNVGIGTTSPNASSLLHVRMCSNSNGDGIRIQAVCSGASGSQPGIAFANISDVKRWSISLDNTSDIIQITNVSGLNALEINQSRIACFACQVCMPVLLASGCIGIGTTDLSNGKLNIGGNTDINSDISTIGMRFRRIATVGYLGTGDWAINGLSTYDFGISSGYCSGALVFGTSAGVERMRIISGGSVGIGTNSPCSSFILHVAQTCSAGLANMSFDNTAGVPCDTGTQGTILRFRTASSDANMRTMGAIASYAMKNIGSGINNHGDLRFYTGVEGEVCERMRIASNGLIGINNTTPVAPLQVVCTPGSFYGIIETTACTTGTAKHFRVHKPNCVEYGIGILANNAFHISTESTFPTTNGFTLTSAGIACFGCQVCAPIFTQIQSGVRTLSIVKSVNVSPSSTGYMTVDMADYMGATFHFVLDITAGAYGNSVSGPGVFKLVFGGYYSTAAAGSCVVLANDMTCGSWAWNRSGTIYCVAVTNNHGTQDRFSVARFDITFCPTA